MKNLKLYLTATLFACAATASVGAENEPVDYQAPEGMVYGGQFIDHILPIEPIGPLRSDVWGAEGVKPRDVLNGLEDPDYSYWGGDIMYEDGKYHMFTCRWREDNVIGDRSGHMTWGSSTVVYAVSDNPIGPYKFVAEIGKGHNPEITKSTDGRYYVGGMNGVAYVSDKIDGPWEKITPKYQWKKRVSTAPNKTYAVREDGSAIVMSQNGLFISEDASENCLMELVDTVIYNKFTDNGGEDPVIWRDEVQYHCIFNGPRIRTKGFYMRSKDGIRWIQEKGVALTADIVRYTNGHKEEWYKVERPKVIQDKYGRATHLHVSAIDISKWDDLANDTHSSKNIIMPLRVPKRMEILNKQRVTNQTSKIEVKILAEEGFDPIKVLDVQTLKFGAPETIDFGKGAKATKSKAVGEDLVVTFEGENGFEDSDFAGKLLGYDKSGELVYGYAKMLPTAEDLRDEIMLHTITNQINPLGEMQFAVNFKSGEERNLCLNFIDLTTGETLSSGVVKEVSGEDIVIVKFKSPKELDLKHLYKFELYLAKSNKKLTPTMPIVSKEVYVLDPNAPAEGIVVNMNHPKELPLNKSVTLSIKYVAHEERDLVVEYIKSRPMWTPIKNVVVGTVNGEGAIDVEISLADFREFYTEGNLCNLRIYLTEKGMDREAGRISPMRSTDFDVVAEQ